MKDQHPQFETTPPVEQETSSDDGNPTPVVRLTVELKSGSSSSWTIGKVTADVLLEAWLDGAYTVAMDVGPTVVTWSCAAIAMIRIEVL